jgi:triphosphatase
MDQHATELPGPLPPEAESITPPAPTAVLELALSPDAADRLFRAPCLSGLRRRGNAAVALTFHDSAEGVLSGQGLALSSAKGTWTLARLRPGEEHWPPATPAPVLAEAPNLAELNLPPVLPVASFEGRRRSVLGPDDRVSVTLSAGKLRAFHGITPYAWLTLTGPSDELRDLARALAQEAAASPPRACLAAEALAHAAGKAPSPRRAGGAEVTPPATVAQAFALLLAHQTDVILQNLRDVVAGTDPEPVHQARVAVRRLRAALSMFAPALPVAFIAETKAMLRALAARLGTARDWDVFATETCAEVAGAIEDRRITALLAACQRKRGAARAALRAWVEGPEGRVMAVELALLPALQSWHAESHEATLAQDAAEFAAGALARRWRHMLRDGNRLADMPPHELHELRKQGKKLRYAAEFFRPCFPARQARRFLARLEALQAELGRVNDAATSTILLDDLGAPGRGWGAGAVAGYLAQRATKSHRRVAAVWDEFREADPFWA